MTNRHKDFLSVVLASCLSFATPAAGATYYVDAAKGHDAIGAGTQTNPFASIQYSVYQTHPGDTVLVNNGTYGPVQINHSGTAGAYITFKAAPGNYPVVTKDGTAWSGIAVQAGQSYITIQGFNVIGNARSITYAQAMASDTTNYTTNGECISVPATAHHINIIGNTLQYCPGAGLIYWGDYGVIDHNTSKFNANWSKNEESGIVIVGENPTSTPGTIIVSNNLVFSNQVYACHTYPDGTCKVSDGQGIIVDSNTYDTPGGYLGRVEIFNNIAYNNGGWGFVVHRSQHVDLYNNTAYQNGLGVSEPAPYTSTGGEVGINASTDVKVYNNIFDGNNNGAWTVWDGEAGITSFSWDNNLIYNPIAGNMVYPYVPVSLPIGPHDIMAAPVFSSWLMLPSVFTPIEGCPCIGSGTGALVPPTDYFGKTRFPARIDQGAIYWQGN